MLHVPCKILYKKIGMGTFRAVYICIYVYMCVCPCQCTYAYSVHIIYMHAISPKLLLPYSGFYTSSLNNLLWKWLFQQPFVIATFYIIKLSHFVSHYCY